MLALCVYQIYPYSFQLALNKFVDQPAQFEYKATCFIMTWNYHPSILLQQLSFIAPLRKLLNLIAFVLKLMHICTCKLNLCLQFRITSIVFTRQRRRCVFSNQSHHEKEDIATNFKMGMSQTIISYRCLYSPPPMNPYQPLPFHVLSYASMPVHIFIYADSIKW